MSANQQKLLKIAQSFIGIPYKYAAKPEDIPKYLDCSSFTQYAYKQIGIDIPRSTILQAAHSGKEIELKAKSSKLKANLQIGDLLFFRGSKGHYNDELFPGREIYIGHVAMNTKNNSAIHASSPDGVKEELIDEIIKTRGPIVLIKRIV